MKHIPSIFLTLLCMLVFTSCGEESGEAGNGSGQDNSEANVPPPPPANGDVSGILSFSGKPCNPEESDYSVPPCSGPYPDKELEIFDSEDTSTPIKKIKTDAKGAYTISLPVGEYVIFTQDGADPEDQAENTFDVAGGKMTTLDLSINTGIQ